MDIGDNLKKLVGWGKDIGNMVTEGAVPVVKASVTALELSDTDQWMNHAMVDQTMTKPNMNAWAGGYNRKSRNAGSFYGGYDAAMRWPDRTEELKTLAKGYQMLDAFKSFAMRKGELGSYSNEMQDALANISGIEAAVRDMKAGVKYDMNDQFNEDIATKAKAYAEQYTQGE